MFRVTLLGTGVPVPLMDRFGACTLVEAGPEKLLFDCGRGATQRLWQLKMPLGAITTLFLTHFHSDHIVGIPDLWLTGWLAPPYGRRQGAFRVIGPMGTKKMMWHLEQAYDADLQIRIHDEKLSPDGAQIVAEDIQPGVVFERNGVKVTAFDVDHGPEIKPAFGYRVDYDGRSVVISGDTRPSQNLERYAQGVDVLVHEVAATNPLILERSVVAQRIIAHHTSPEEAGRIFERVKPRLAVFTHVALFTMDPAFPAPSVADLIARTRQTYDGPLEVGEDLFSVDIGETLEVRSPNARS